MLLKEVTMAGLVASCQREQRPRTQYRKFVEHETGIHGHGGKPIDRRLRLLPVAIRCAFDQ